MTSTEIKELEKKITELREAYWNGECTTPDAEYDKLVEKLRAAEPMNRLLAIPEHGAFTTRTKVMHKAPMLSLQKVYNKVDLVDWIDSVSRSDDEEFIVQPKYDGISCHYDHTVWSTRGNGVEGEDISNTCMCLCEVEKADGTPLKIGDDFYGEIVIKKSDFETTFKSVKRENGELFKTPRNAVAGLLNADDPTFYRNQNALLTLVDYNKYSFSMKKSEVNTKWDIIKGIINSLDYPMDGIVVKIADESWYHKQGFTAHHPKGAMAFKFENASDKTFLKSIEWGMGKEFITATAVFQPVRLNGVMVSRASIPMKSKTLPCVMNGDFNYDALVTVERAGDVIPHITEISKSPIKETFGITQCPFCGSPIEVLESGVRCTNPDCRRKKIHRLYEALVILGAKFIGETTVINLCDSILANDPITLRSWMAKVPYSSAEIANVPNYGEKSGKLIADEALRIRNTTLARFIAALGIPNVGIMIGTEIERAFTSVEDFVINATVDSLSKLNGVGDKMAHRIFDYVKANAGDILSLSYLFNIEQSKKEVAVATANESVCFTGAMRLPRYDMSKIARNAGYIVQDAVTRGLDILVVADGVDLKSSKCVKAQKYGTRIVREKDFLTMCGK